MSTISDAFAALEGSALADVSGVNTGDQNSQIDIYTSNSTWTKPSWAKTVEVYCMAGGGGGGGGRQGGSGTNRYGGGAGGAVSTFHHHPLNLT